MKLGLALSGGGFRASLFHIGVLARLAELDLLGKVEVLSTVSGGSIVGAMYYLMLKDLLETPAAPPPVPSAPAPLSAADFVALVGRLEEDFLAGVQKNPRAHVLTHPLENIRMALMDYSRTDRMAELYNRFFYRAVWERCTGEYQSAIPLRDIKITPPWCPSRDAYNAAHPYKIPMLIVNATTLNTGKNFRFTANEVGDPDLGYIRFDEVAQIVALRRWLADRTLPAPEGLSPDALQLATGAAVESLVQEGGPIGAMLAGLGGSRLLTLPLDALSKLKDLAWDAAAPADASGARAALDAALAQVVDNPGLLRARLGAFRFAREAPFTPEALFDLLYWVRMAGRVTDDCDEDLDGIKLEAAVGSSAAVPGIFQPLVFRNLYDDRTVEAVRLVDGGVYDNQGLTALFEEECTHIICSDASGQLVFERAASGKIFGVMPRANEVLMEKIRQDEMSLLLERHAATEDLAALGLGRGPHPPPPAQQDAAAGLRRRFHVAESAFFHLKSEYAPTPGGMPALKWTREVSELRTDLDSFTDREAFAVMYHGYYLATHAVTPKTFPSCVPARVPESPARWRFGAIQPLLASPDLQRHLAVGAGRLFKVFSMGGAWAALAWLCAGALFLAGWTWIPLVTLNEILVWPLRLFGTEEPITVVFYVPFAEKLAALSPQLKSMLEFSILPVGDLFDLPLHIPLLLLLLLGALVASRLWQNVKAFLLRRNLAGLWKGAWSLASLVSRFKRLPLAPLAIVWSAVAAAVSWAYLLIFNRLYLRAGRL